MAKPVPPFDRKSLEAYKLWHDPRIAEAKKLLADTIETHQMRIISVRPPQQELEQSYEELIKTFGEYRGGSLYFPYIGSGIGNGPLVELLDGSVKYDLISGIGVHYWGHQNPELFSVGLDATLSNTIMQGHLQQNVETIKLSHILIEASGLDHCFLTSSGAMACENALKIAFQRKFPATRILAFEHCFMGRSLVLSQITDKAANREQLPLYYQVDHIPFYDYLQPEESIKKSVDALKSLLKRYPKQYAVMCFELIQGEGGFYPGTTEFFTALMDVLKEHDVAILIDEVQTFGRTSSLFAFQHFKLEKYVDIVTIGKLSLVCATLFRSDFKPKPGLLSQTFTSSTAAIQTSKVMIRGLLKDGYFGPEGKINKMHRLFTQRLEQLEKKYPDRVKGPYGLGGMVAFTPFDGEPKRVAKFIQDLFKAGIISFIAGSNPTRVRFLLPIGALEEKDLDPIFSILEGVIKKTE